MNESLVGVDLGGTQVRAIVCDREGHILSRAATLTLAHEGRDAVIRRILDTIIDAVGPRLWTEIAGIGVGAPGPLNPYSGVVVHAPNLPGWEDVPLRQLIAERFCVPVALGNDANLAALGEQRFGAGRGVDDLVYMTISTGIGGGIISGGELFLGHGGFAGEIGHQTILAGGPLCGCGNHGCLEALAAGPAIGRMGREAAEEGRGEALLALAGESPHLGARRLAGRGRRRRHRHRDHPLRRDVHRDWPRQPGEHPEPRVVRPGRGRHARRAAPVRYHPRDDPADGDARHARRARRTSRLGRRRRPVGRGGAHRTTDREERVRA